MPNVILFPMMHIAIVDLIEYWYQKGYRIVSSKNGWLLLEEL